MRDREARALIEAKAADRLGFSRVESKSETPIVSAVFAPWSRGTAMPPKSKSETPIVSAVFLAPIDPPEAHPRADDGGPGHPDEPAHQAPFRAIQTRFKRGRPEGQYAEVEPGRRAPNFGAETEGRESRDL